MRQSASIMAQRSVLEQTTQVEQTTHTKSKKPFLTYRWMRYFYTESTSPDHRPISELQRRATWIAVALLLQSANEVPFLVSLSPVLPFLLIIGSFVAMWMAIRPAPSQKNTEPSSNRKTIAQPKLWQRIVLILTLLVTLGGAYECVVSVIQCFQNPSIGTLFSNDGTSLDANAAILLVEGEDPYTDSNIPQLVRRFNLLPQWTTPLREGQFANRLNYPTTAELQSVLDTSLKTGSVPELEAKVSYPALSFLTLVPFALIQNYNVLPFYLICYVLIVFIAWKSVRRELRPWVLLLSMANVPMWSSTMGGNLDVLYTLFLIVSWIKRDMRWVSAIFFGLALATKQLSWYFVPFYGIMLLRHYGWKECIQRLAIAGSIALVINLPFIMWDYHTWFAGIMAPVADPMFPMGVGLISLSTSHLLPYYPTWVYTILELGGWLGTSIWYWRVCKQRPEAAWLFAIMPIFLAWRSLSSYFYCVAFPMFMLFSAQRRPVTQHVFSFLRNKSTGNRRLPSSISI
jgi:hypothetical protein